MIRSSLLFLAFLFIVSCSTYEKKDLYGHWQNAKWDFVFNEDGSCKVGQGGDFLEGKWTYRTFGNTLEIAKNGSVFLSNLTIKGIENDELKLEFRMVTSSSDKADNIQTLKRKK